MARKTKGTPEPADVYAGQQLKKYRKDAGLTQEKLGEAIGITFQQIQKYERGYNRISVGRLDAFSKVLGVPVTFFFEGAQVHGAEMLHERIRELESRVKYRDAVIAEVQQSVEGVHTVAA